MPANDRSSPEWEATRDRPPPAPVGGAFGGPTAPRPSGISADMLNQYTDPSSPFNPEVRMRQSLESFRAGSQVREVGSFAAVPEPAGNINQPLPGDRLYTSDGRCMPFTGGAQTPAEARANAAKK